MARFLRALRDNYDVIVDRAFKVMCYLTGGLIVYIVLKGMYDAIVIALAPLF